MCVGLSNESFRHSQVILVHLTCGSSNLHLAGTKMWLIVTPATGRAAGP